MAALDGTPQKHTSDMCTRAAELIVLRRLWFSFFTASSCACSSACLATLSAFRIWARQRSVALSVEAGALKQATPVNLAQSRRAQHLKHRRISTVRLQQLRSRLLQVRHIRLPQHLPIRMRGRHVLRPQTLFQNPPRTAPRTAAPGKASLTTSVRPAVGFLVAPSSRVFTL